MESPETLPLIPLRDVVVFPRMMVAFIIGRESSLRALEHALMRNKRLFLAAQRDGTVEAPDPADIHRNGCIAQVAQTLKLPDGSVKALVEGVDRARVLEWKEEEGLVLAAVTVVPRTGEPGDEAQMKRVVSLFEEYVKLAEDLHYDPLIAPVKIDDPGKLADTVAAHLRVGVDEKQNLLTIQAPGDRLARLEEILPRELKRVRTTPEHTKPRREFTELLRVAARLKVAEVVHDAEGLERVVANRRTVQLAAPSALVSDDRRVSDAGIERLRAMLDQYERVLAIAGGNFDVIEHVVADDDPALVSHLRWAADLMKMLQLDASRTWREFGLERRKSNEGPPHGVTERRWKLAR